MYDNQNKIIKMFLENGLSSIGIQNKLLWANTPVQSVDMLAYKLACGTTFSCSTGNDDYSYSVSRPIAAMPIQICFAEKD